MGEEGQHASPEVGEKDEGRKKREQRVIDKQFFFALVKKN